MAVETRETPATDFIAVAALAEAMDIPYQTMVWWVKRLGFAVKRFPLDRKNYISTEQARAIRRLRDEARARRENTI
jgi:hypothetical protein